MSLYLLAERRLHGLPAQTANLHVSILGSIVFIVLIGRLHLENILVQSPTFCLRGRNAQNSHILYSGLFLQQTEIGKIRHFVLFCLKFDMFYLFIWYSAQFFSLLTLFLKLNYVLYIIRLVLTQHHLLLDYWLC